MCQAAPESTLQNFDFCKQVHVMVAAQIGHSETIYTTKIHKFFKLGFFKELFVNIYKHTTAYVWNGQETSDLEPRGQIPHSHSQEGWSLPEKLLIENHPSQEQRVKYKSVLTTSRYCALC